MMNLTEKKESKVHNIAVDAEWYTNMLGFDPKPGFERGEIQPLTVQYYHEQSGRKIIYVTAEYYENLQQHAEAQGIELVPWHNLDDGTLVDLLYRLRLAEVDVRLLMFYSPTDLRLCFGKSQMEEYYEEQVIVKKRNLRNFKGPIKIADNCKVRIHDLKGYAPTSLADFAKALKVEMASKHDLDQYKSKMNVAIQELPEVFLRYSMGDTEQLVEMFHKFAELVVKVQRILGIEEDCFDEETIKLTNGSIVADTLLKFIRSRASNKKAFDYAILKHGILDEGMKGHANYRDLLHKLNSTIKNNSDINLKEHEEDLDKLFKSKSFRHSVLEQASVKYFGSQADTSVYLSIVQGGRCVNERSSEYRVGGVALDIDMSSCYGSALEQFTYPVGLPTVISQHHDEKQLTLGQFLKEHQDELEDNLWQVVVAGELSFKQDLVFSKKINPKQIKIITLNDDFEKGDGTEHREDIAHIPGNFLLSRCEIENGIITSSILETIKKVSTDQERNEWWNLEVRSAAYYAKSDRVESLDEWIEEIIKDKGQRTVVGRKHGNTTDNRTRKWCGIHLKEFIGKLIAERKAAKSRGEDEYQTILKLFVNTTYGIIASPYFPVGNIVVANNITALARRGAWQLNKALHTRQSITDGGGYSPLAVAHRKPNAKNAGFNVMADNTQWLDKKNYTRVIAPMDGLENGQTWDQWALGVKARYESIKGNKEEVEKYQKELGTFLDLVAKTHIDNFWSHYGLEFPFALEHKIKNTSSAMAYFRKGDYGFRTVWGDDVFKSRGNKLFVEKPGEEKLKSHPTYQLLKNILDDVDEFPQDMDYNTFSILSPNLWLKAVNSKNGYHHIFNAHPGETIIEQRTACYNNLHTPIDRIGEFEARDKRKKVNHGKSVEFFERYRHLGIGSVIRAMNQNRLA